MDKSFTDFYLGWNAALEVAAKSIEDMDAFPKDSMQSFATFIRNLKEKL